MHCVDLGESFPTRIYLQKSASIQPRTSPSKFGGKIQFTIHFTPYAVTTGECGSGSSPSAPPLLCSFLQLTGSQKHEYYNWDVLAPSDSRSDLKERRISSHELGAATKPEEHQNLKCCWHFRFFREPSDARWAMVRNKEANEK